MDISVNVYRHLSALPNIAGVKEASTDITKISKIRRACGTDLPIWTGNDEQTVPVMAMGGLGVISVVSNVLPGQTQAMCHAALTGDYETAVQLQRQLLPLIDLLFCEVNPIPVKEAMKCIGFDCGNCRLPLCRLTKEHRQQLERYFA
jgi:4-hydroxy-tetrahydrodipicolinate synthase